LNKKDVLNIQWEYASKPDGVKTPFVVPLEIAGINKTQLSETGILDDWVNFSFKD
jgi:hypothetical protein